MFSIAVGAMMSSGIFVLPGLAFAQAGPAVFLSYFLAGVLASTGVLCVAELATALPRAGGDYFYVSRSLGTGVGTISGLLSWFALVLKTAFAIFGIAEILYLSFPVVPLPVFGVAATALFVMLNLIGVREATRFQVGLVALLLGISAVFIVAGAPRLAVPRFDPFAPYGGNAILITVGFVFVSYGGVLHVASVAEEVKNPKRTLPYGLLASIMVVTGLYSLILLVTVGLLDAEDLRSSFTPVADAARVVMGGVGYWTVIVASMLAFVTTANAGIMAASRYPLAMGRDGLLPRLASRVSARQNVPYVAICITGGLIAVSLFLPLEVLVKAASAVIIASFILANLSVIILRESRLQNYHPSFRVPLYPWLNFVATAAFVFLLFDMGFQALLVCMVLVLLGFLAYLHYGRKQAHTDYALLALLERVINRRLTSYNLESELREILYERDEIVKDRFDDLVESCPVIDLPGEADRDRAFDEIAAALSRTTGLEEQQLRTLLSQREAESSTAISSFMAIPHLLLPGSDQFQIVLVRSPHGVRFSDEHQAVSCIVVLAGTADNRNFHLRCLSAIAQVAQSPSFEQKWMNARGAEGLRDALLLGKRRREV